MFSNTIDPSTCEQSRGQGLGLLRFGVVLAAVWFCSNCCTAQDGTSASSKQPISRLLFGSCIKQNLPIPILKTIIEHKPDVFVFLGDNIYGDTTDMDVLRAKYTILSKDKGFAQLGRTCPILATWDDHDYGVNDGGSDYLKRQQSEQVFLDFWKVPANSARRKRPGIYDSVIYGPPGKRVQVILLDTRYFRSALKRGAQRRTGGPYAPDADPTKTMLGEAQWKWLKQQLLKPAELRVIATSIQCVSQDDGQETWSNLPVERARFFRLIRETKANGVIMISGDRHWSELSRTVDGLDYPVYDLTSSSFNQIHKRGTPTINKFRHLPKTYHKENFGAIEIDWTQRDPSIALEIRDIQNQVQIKKSLRLSELRRSEER